MCAFRPCISFTPKNTRHRSPTDLCNAVENQAAGLFFIYRFVLSLQEGRRPSRPGGRRAPLISIHAPARGATGPARRSRPNPLFQFTPLREGRPMRKYRAIRMKQFQFTPLREGRRTLLPGAGRRDYFNSRPCERGDFVPARLCWDHWQISIHAPARGATRVKNRHFEASAISIHAPARGATS